MISKAFSAAFHRFVHRLRPAPVGSKLIVAIYRHERGYQRCSEVAALSDELYAADARLRAFGVPPLTLKAARTEVLHGVSLVTYAVRPLTDPAAGRSLPPCVSCYLLQRHLGFQLKPPSSVGGHG